MGLFDNFGTGVALQGQPRFFENMYMAGRRRADADAARKSAEDEKALERFQGDLVIKDVHRLDYNDAVQDASTTLSKVMDLKEKRPNNWRNEARKIMQDFTNRQAQRVQRKAQLEGLVTDMRARKQANNFIAPDQERAAEIIQSGTWNDFSTLQSPLGYVSFNPDDRGVSMKYAPAMDARSADVQAINDPELYTDTSFLTQNAKLPDGRVVMTTAKGIPVKAADANAIAQKLGVASVPSLESINAKLLADPNYAERKAAEMYYSGRLQGYEKMTPEERYQALSAQNLEDLKKIAGVKTSEKVVAPFKSSTKSSDKDKDMGLDDMLASGKITQNEKYLQGYGSVSEDQTTNQKVAGTHKEITALYSMNVKAGTPFVVNADSRSIHLTNSTPFTKAEQFNFVPGSIKVIRVYKDPYKRTETVAVPYVFGKRVQYNPNSRDDANPVKEIEDVAIPLEKVQQGLNAKPYDVATKWAFEAAERENSKRKISGLPTSEAPKPSGKKPVFK